MSTTKEGLEVTRLAKEYDTVKAEFRKAHKLTRGMDSVAYSSYEPTLREIKTRMEDLESELFAAKVVVGVKARALLYVSDPLKLQLIGNTPTASHLRGYEFVSKITSQSNVVAPELVVRTKYQRAMRASSNGTEIKLNLASTTRTAVHEMGHNLDRQLQILESKDSIYKVPTGIQSKKYLHSRTVGELPEKLRKLFPSHGYKADEVTKKDKFKDAYTGRLYPQGDASEILSMGVQYLYDDPIGFAQTDPAHFKFVVNTLRGFPDDSN